jgi:hypothetical protein
MKSEDPKPTTEAAAPIIVEEFPKNLKETLRISLTEYQGHSLCEIRAWYPSVDGMKPGKGISLQRSQIPLLVRALRKAERIIKGEKPAAGASAAPYQDGQAEDELQEAA